MNKYQKRKNSARQEAIEWQADFGFCNYAWSDLAFWSNHFSRLAKRYGLIKEFRANGII